MAGQWHEPDVGRAGVSGWISACVSSLGRCLLAEADRWFLWSPVLFAAGIGFYFSFDTEPSILIAAAMLLGAGAILALARRRPIVWALSAAAMCAALGFADAKLRVVLLATSMLERPAGVVVVTGWVAQVEPRRKGAHRITLSVQAVEGPEHARKLRKLRLSSRFSPPPAPGDAVRIKAVLRPLPGPVQPRGFDFARKAWFLGLGATGFALGPPERLAAPPRPSLGLRAHAWVDRLRRAVTARVRAVLPGETGAIAAALITGERGRIADTTLDALRHSGLAHLLAISGLHMALMAGSLYWLLRASLAAFPSLALRWPVKKIAAVAALAGAAFYLALSGAAIATQRAFLMMALMFLAILLARPAITLRNVAVAALVVLALFPESLFDVSFQMSFAAAGALVAFYERWSRRAGGEVPASAAARWLRRAGQYLSGIALTTLVASIAVAPFAAYHFHKIAQYSLAANLAAMPVFGLLVMPMALAALLAMPFGLESWPLQAMSGGIRAIQRVAETVAGWDGAVLHVATMPLISLLALVFGGLWLCLWGGRWRLAGLAVAAAGLACVGAQPRPDVLIARNGAAVAVRAPTGRLMVHGRDAARYSVERWLAADGDDPAAPAAAGDEEQFRCDDIACVARVRGRAIAWLLHPAALAEECRRADIVISQFPLGKRCKGARLVVDRFDLKDDGAHAIYIDDTSIRLETVARMRGRRPWTPERRLVPDQADKHRPGLAQAADK